MTIFSKEVAKYVLNEVGQRVKPYSLSSINFKKDGLDYFYKFNDEHKNEVTVKFEATGNNRYNIGYSINNQLQQAEKSTTSHFFKVVSTVIEIIQEFIKQFGPQRLEIFGTDKNEKFLGQKIRIYKAYMVGSFSSDEYECFVEGDKITIRKIK